MQFLASNLVPRAGALQGFLETPGSTACQKLFAAVSASLHSLKALLMHYLKLSSIVIYLDKKTCL
jgi:hypothetical protein